MTSIKYNLSSILTMIEIHNVTHPADGPVFVKRNVKNIFLNVNGQ